MFTRAKYIILDTETGEVMYRDNTPLSCYNAPHRGLEHLCAPAGMVYVLKGSRLITLTAEEG